VQAQAQQVVGLLRVLGEFLEFVEDVAVQEAEQDTVDVQGIRSAEAGAGEQRQDVFERAQSAGRAQGLTFTFNVGLQCWQSSHFGG